MGEEIVTAATRLFAALGYDGVTGAMIAETAGVAEGDVAALGGKAGVYQAVMGRVLALQVKLLDEMHRVLTPDVAGLHGMVDMFVDFYERHPEAIALWQHRGLSDAADLPNVESAYATPVIQGISDILGRAGLSERARHTLLNVLGWCFYGFMTIGLIHPDGGASRWEDATARARFRLECHHVIDVVAAADPPASAATPDSGLS
ncbi:TetR family transcriptional regulator [Actinocorallia herbida]|uniref:TetR family transcriptional regulator n=1 Tax=Actinocorallia herbida TaxID=58109 RepID=A0A3N1CUW1_9ACTN|nr:TetR/AcrR family transcriptional regulator [Actinocorallia herbida]ROO85082.1 TetR family transcriptional regulator [Actinocorallia herbida]